MKVSELLSDESKWTKGSYAKDRTGAQCSESSDKAARYCLVGAIYVCYPRVAQSSPVCSALYNKLHTPLVDWNDAPERTFADVKALIEDLDI